MVDSFTWQNISAPKGPSSVAKKVQNKSFPNSPVLSSEAVYHMSYAQEPINTYTYIDVVMNLYSITLLCSWH